MTNYNQTVKILYSHFSEKKAGAILYRLEKRTLEMVDLFKKVIQLTEEFDQKHLKNTE